MNGRNSRVSGIVAIMSRPKISGLRCVAIGRFSAVFSRFSAADSALAIPVSGDRNLSRRQLRFIDCQYNWQTGGKARSKSCGLGHSVSSNQSNSHSLQSL